jgi:ADP-ribosyl-[dinitrogen reductase] hydrolase
MPLLGSCLCGAVRYAAEQLDAPIVHCHCATCRKAHAAAFNSSAGVERHHFRWTAGEDKLSVYASSPGKNRWFCSLCGSQMIAEFPARSRVILRVATFGDDPGVRPTAHIWTSEDAPWLIDDAPAARYPEGQPGH